MAELHVELVAADRKVWSGEASLVVARTSSGDIGVMPGHQPLLGVLESGPVTIRTTGESGEGTVVAAVHGGFISFADDKLSLVAEVAELADEIDVERAERAREQAKSETDASAERRADVRLRAVAVR
ncbi:F0F1 ATP synthase subunit epsilon [Streptomyces daliensis]|uniref:ATP synthase epsilon chain n=1 Tax=Streptomyces daliensis TaxID=299421 RepID=A0A8T4IUF3_9ACTN|nr:F0F1 ATP synthase subunit epsilon [Streptomyces daliensis]